MKPIILQTKFFFLLFLMCLLISGGISYAQDPQNPQNPQEAIDQELQADGDGIKGEIKGEIKEEHDTQNLNNLLKDYNKDSEKVLKDAEKLYPQNEATGMTDQELGNTEDDSPEATMKKLGGGIFNKKETPQDLKNIKYSEAMKMALEPLQKMPEKELAALLKQATNGSPAEEYLKRFPKLGVFSVRLIKDKNALPSFAKIADDQDKAIRFAGIMISTILFSFFLKRMMKKEGRSIWKAMSLWLFRFVIVTSLRFGIIILFYGSEISPIFKIASKTFFIGQI